MFIKNDLVKTLKALRLSGFIAALPARIKQAKIDNLDTANFLEIILGDELDKRKDRLLERRIKSARINSNKRLDNLNFDFNSKLPRKTLFELSATRLV